MVQLSLRTVRSYFNLFLEDLKKTEYYTRLNTMNLLELPDIRVNIKESDSLFYVLKDIGTNEVEIKKEVKYGTLYYQIIFYIDTKFLVYANKKLSQYEYGNKDFADFIDKQKFESNYFDIICNFSLKISSDEYEFMLNDRIDLSLLLDCDLAKTKLTKNLYRYGTYIVNKSLFLSYDNFKRLIDSNIHLSSYSCPNVIIKCNSFLQFKNLMYIFFHKSYIIDNSISYEICLEFKDRMRLEAKKIIQYLNFLLEEYKKYEERELNIHKYYDDFILKFPYIEIMIPIQVNILNENNKDYKLKIENFESSLKNYNIKLFFR